MIAEEKDLIIKFPEDKSPSGTALTSTPSNPVDQAADFLPRALVSIRGNFKESVFLFIIVGYIFIAAFGHMERLDNYIGYFSVILLSIFMYKIWDKFKIKDTLYIIVIIILLTCFLLEKFNIHVLNWF